jgi:hypothetical protein
VLTSGIVTGVTLAALLALRLRSRRRGVILIGVLVSDLIAFLHLPVFLCPLSLIFAILISEYEDGQEF